MTDPTSIPNFPPPAGESPLRGRVLDVLQDEGFRPDIDTDGDVSFKVEGQQLFVRCMEGEPAMMRIFGQWQITEDLPQDVLKHLLAANDVTLSLNIIKTGIANGTLVVTGEHLVSQHDDVKQLVQSTTQMVLQAVQLWHRAVTSDGPHAATSAEPPAIQQPAPEANGEA
ncbi:hypothetical protein [Rudaeicoccus suwonensis]|uniref:Sensory transduction regulator n=1 Tax=Rudaeicoccus suwonensis TaxID=657409 RepID=A0A561DX28_9MICO|nr:hypothetical protein [Rudaeicoccus suwonensis]TWE07913.1 hypothetical protein BKA23_3280 [Rudaeicoccus suwonensis]